MDNSNTQNNQTAQKATPLKENKPKELFHDHKDPQIHKKAFALTPINQESNDLSLNQTLKLSDQELYDSFEKHYNQNMKKYSNDVSSLKKKYSAFCKDVCEKTNNKKYSDLILNDFNYEALQDDLKKLEYQHLRNFLAHHDRIIKKDVLDYTDEYRTLTYTARIAVILKKLPALTYKAKAAAYASEVGESFRPVVPRTLVNSLYVVSVSYVLMDIIGRTYCVKDQGSDKMSIFAFDTFLFHLFGSLILPAVFIHKLVKTTTKGMVKYCPNYLRLHSWIPALLALGSVPFIIEPIDHVTEFMLDKAVRPFYIDKIAKEAHKLHH